MDNEMNIDDLFAQARTEPVVASFDETKARFVESLTAMNGGKTAAKGGSFIFKNWIIMLSVIGSIITVAAITLSGGDKTPEEKDSLPVVVSEKGTEKLEENRAYEVIEEAEVEQKQSRKEAAGSMELTPRELEEIRRNNGQQLVPFSIKRASTITIKATDQPYIPKLTEEEIKANNKRKKLMAKRLIKYHKDDYAYTPSGSFTYEGKKISVQAFFIGRKEVTNIEYKTFLFDLLVQGRKADFLKAAPDQRLWTKVLGERFQYMMDTYFSGKDSEEFPVVNVSSTGAEMYCIWFSKLTYNWEGRKKIPGQLNDVRIPTRIEWIYASKHKEQFWPYNGANAPFLMVNCQLPYCENASDVATEWCQNESDQLHLSAYGKMARTVDEKNGQYKCTGSVKSFETKDYGLYNLLGNASEMYAEIENGRWKIAGAIGGGWMNSRKEIESGKDPYSSEVNGHPNVGFRVCTTYFSSQMVGEMEKK